MKAFQKSCLLGMTILLLTGCDRGSKDPSDAASNVVPPPEPVAVIPADDPESVAAIEAITDKIRRNGDNIIDVDYRDLQIDDSALTPLSGLPRLRALRLAKTPIGDEGLKTIGQLASLEDLDLRNCPITDDGLASLAPLSKLKALRLSGETGDCGVT